MSEENSMENALETLKKGGTILYPTDTIWGIGCDAMNVNALQKIFKIKKRDPSKSCIILVDGVQRLQNLVEVPEMAWELIDMSEKPLTLIYEKATGLPQELLADDGSIGIRIVKDTFCRNLITRLKSPLVSTSANISGTPAPLKFSDIAPEITNAVDYIVKDPENKASEFSGSSIIKIWLDGRIKVIRE